MKIVKWLHERFPIDYQKFVEISENIFVKAPIPNHMKKWWYCSGAAPLILLLIQVVTGILLTFYFVPSPELAYESVRHLSEDVRLGFWIRGIHRWGSNLMVIALLLHMTRVFFTRVYRKQRELNWIIGVLLLGITLTLSFTGYSLIYNQLSYWATTVGTNMMAEVPLIGKPLLIFMRGGEEVTANTLTRFFTIHVGLLPPLLLLLVAVHIIILRLHGMAELEGREGEVYYPFYPHHFFKIVFITLFIITVLSTLSIVMPPGLGEPADPLNTPQHIKPEWYFYAIFRILQLVPLKVGIYGIASFLVVFTFWPFIDDFISRRLPKKVKLHYIVGILTVLAMLALTIWEMLVF